MAKAKQIAIPTTADETPRNYHVIFRSDYKVAGLEEALWPAELTLPFKCDGCSNSIEVKVEWVKGKPDFEKRLTCICNEKLKICEVKMKDHIPGVIAKISVFGEFRLERMKLLDDDVVWKSTLHNYGLWFNTKDGGTWNYEEEEKDKDGEENDEAKNVQVSPYCSGLYVKIKFA